MRIIDWSSDVCSSDLRDTAGIAAPSAPAAPTCRLQWGRRRGCGRHRRHEATSGTGWSLRSLHGARGADRNAPPRRSEEHTSELQSLMRISYAVFCLKKKKTIDNI